MNRDHYVYVAECGQYCKVGFSVNPEVRYTQFKTHNPHEVKTFKTYKVSSAQEARLLEAHIHREMKKHEYHKWGEWFYFNEESAVLIDSIVKNVDFKLLSKKMIQWFQIRDVETIFRGAKSISARDSLYRKINKNISAMLKRSGYPVASSILMASGNVGISKIPRIEDEAVDFIHNELRSLGIEIPKLSRQAINYQVDGKGE